MERLINVTGLPKEAVIAALWNHAKPQSFFDIRRSVMSETRARELVANPAYLYFDWVDGRCIKAHLIGDHFSPYLYDRDNGGEGAARRVIEQLRKNLNLEIPNAKVSEVVESPSGEVYGDHSHEGQVAAEEKVHPND